MLTSVEIHSYYGENYFGVEDPPIVFPLGILDGAQYFVKEIDGLGPTKAEIVLTTYSGMPGGAYQAANVATRNIVAQIGFNPDFEVDDPFGELRRALYSRMNPEMRVDLLFISDNMETVKIAAYIESFEPSIFSADPMMTFSFICPDPYFYSLVEITGSRTGSGRLQLTNPGNAQKTGLTLFFDGISAVGVNSLSLDNRVFPHPRHIDNTMIATVGTYVVGEQMVFKFVTTPGSKSAGWMLKDTYDVFVKPGIENGGEAWEEYANNLLGYVNGWAYITPGLNDMYVGSPGGTPDLITVSFTPKYVGL